MQLIQSLPYNFINEYNDWNVYCGKSEHIGRKIDPWPQGASEPTSGSGREFLKWNMEFLNKFKEWSSTLPSSNFPDELFKNPWKEIPSFLKSKHLGWNSMWESQYQKIQYSNQFTSLDELGKYIEWGVFVYLKVALSRYLGNNILISSEAPKSLCYWQLLELITHWRNDWLKSRENNLINNMQHIPSLSSEKKV